jgi:hypothetical protein
VGLQVGSGHEALPNMEILGEEPRRLPTLREADENKARPSRAVWCREEQDSARGKDSSGLSDHLPGVFNVAEYLRAHGRLKRAIRKREPFGIRDGHSTHARIPRIDHGANGDIDRRHSGGFTKAEATKPPPLPISSNDGGAAAWAASAVRKNGNRTGSNNVCRPCQNPASSHHGASSSAGVGFT